MLNCYAFAGDVFGREERREGVDREKARGRTYCICLGLGGEEFGVWVGSWRP